MFLRPTGKETGDDAEAQAKSHLESAGLQTVERNYRCRRGEIDLIMRHGSTLVFVEVRYRKNSTFGSAVESITATKRRRIITAASHYLAVTRLSDSPCRFDVVAITGEQRQQIDWIQDAFQLN
ncbi:MAG: YraN family protein [Sedimenticola sp.]